LSRQLIGSSDERGKLVAAGKAAAVMLAGVALACAAVVAIALSAGLEWAPLLIPIVWAFGSMVILGGLVAALLGLVEVSESRRRRRGPEP
jgi:hypothetical protein